MSNLSTHDTIQAYSMWLDAQGLVAADDTPGADTRTHEELAAEFIAQWDGKTLAGK